MQNPEITKCRPRSVRVTLWAGWIWFAVFFFNPATLMNLGSNFLFIWLPSVVLFAIPLTLVAKGSNYGRVALNIILPATLLFLGFNLLRTIDSMLPQTLLRFLLMFCLFWLPVFVVLICINLHSAREWFYAGSASRHRILEVILGLCIALVWSLMFGVAMVCTTSIFWPIQFFIGACIQKPASVGFYGIIAFYAMVVGCLSILIAGLPAGLYIVTEDVARKAVYRKYFWRMIYWGLGVMALVILIAVIAIVVSR